MKIKYVIEKEIEISDNCSDDEIEQIIKSQCEDENGLDYLWERADESFDLLSVFRLLLKEIFQKRR